MENTNGKKLYEVAEIQLTYRSDVKPSYGPRSQLLEIQVLHHVIVTTEGYFSFADEGLS